MKRMQFEVPEDKFERLQALMRQCKMESQKDLFQNALAMFEWAVRERSRGRIIASVDESLTRFKELSMPSLDEVRVVEPAATASTRANF